MSEEYEKRCYKGGFALWPEPDTELAKALTPDDKKEFEAIPFASVRFTHEVQGRGDDAKKDSYYGVVTFDKYATHLRFPLDRNGSQFMIAQLYDAKGTYVPVQFTVQRRVRLVRVHFGERVVPMCEVFCAPGLVVTVQLTDDLGRDFIRLLKLMSAKNVDGFAEKWRWFDRDANPSEKVAEPAAESDQQ